MGVGNWLWSGAGLGDYGLRFGCSKDGKNAYFAQKLLELTDKIRRQSAHLEFPMQHYTEQPLSNPALQFVNYVCHVFGLDKRIQHEVQLLKRVGRPQSRYLFLSKGPVLAEVRTQRSWAVVLKPCCADTVAHDPHQRVLA